MGTPYGTAGGPRPNYPPEKSAKFSQINRADILSSRWCSKLLTKRGNIPILARVHETEVVTKTMTLSINISGNSLTLIPTIIIDYMKPSVTIEWLMIQIALEQS